MYKYDTIVYNSKIYSLEKENEFFYAMGIKNGKIVKLATGNIDLNDSKEVINANSKTIIPGFIDSHMHFIPSIAFSSLGFQICNIIDNKILPDNLEGIKNKLINFTKSYKNTILICSNYIIPAIKEKRLPFSYELEKWLPGKLVVVFSIDGHSCSFSTSLLKKLEIKSSNKGIISGKQHEKAVNKLNSLISKSVGILNFIKGTEKLVNEIISYGIVGLHCMEGVTGNEKDFVLWLFRKIASKLPFYIRMYPQITDVNKLKKIFFDMTYNRMGGCGEAQIDGSVSSKTAAFYNNYKYDKTENKGVIFYKYNDLFNIIQKAYNNNCQYTAHAIGTKAIDLLIKCYDDILSDNQDNNNKFRFRIEHFDFPSTDAINKAFDKLKLIIAIQPGFTWLEEKILNTYHEYLDNNILKLRTPLKTIVKKGGILCGSSDNPVLSLNPFIQIHAMVNYPIKNERLSVFEAIRTYTYNGAYATFEEDTRGTMKEGKFADFIILNENPFEVSKEKLLNTKVIATYIKGEKIGKIKLLNRILKKKNKL